MARNPKIGGSKPALSDVIGLTGMTLREAAEYLNARGITATEAGVKAWTRGAYNPPAEVLEALWQVVVWVLDPVLEDGLDYLPDEVVAALPAMLPESVHLRAENVASMADWWETRHPTRNF